MAQNKESLALLPNGFADLLPPEADKEFDAIGALMKLFGQSGYRRIKPPLFEFEESLSASGPGASIMQGMFRLMDPMSHRMLGVRSDITAQIARIVRTRLAADARPLRLTYANDVLRTKGSAHRTERQFCQVGCELIGPDHVSRDVEACVLAVAGLKTLGIRDITLDLSYPALVRGILKDVEDETLRQLLRESLERRDAQSLDRIDHAAAPLLKTLLLSSGFSPGALESLNGLALHGDAKTWIARLSDICHGVQQALDEMGFDDVRLSIDTVENRGFSYKSGFAFGLFVRNVAGALGRGGRYDIRFGPDKTSESAAGFTLYMDTVGRALPEAEGKKIIYLADTESWKTVRDLQAQGHNVLRGATPEDRAQCTHEYKDGNIEKIKG